MQQTITISAHDFFYSLTNGEALETNLHRNLVYILPVTVTFWTMVQNVLVMKGQGHYLLARSAKTYIRA